MIHIKGKIENGKLVVDKKHFNHLTQLLDNGDYLLLLSKISDKTQRECQLQYFAILGQWSIDTGWSKDDLHEMMKSELFVELFDSYTSTTELTPEDWTIVFLNLENFLILKFENR